MPIPLIPLLLGAVAGKASKGSESAQKSEKQVPVSGRIKKDGTRGKAFMRKAPKKK